MKLNNILNSEVDVQPTRAINGTISSAGITLATGQLLPAVAGIVKLPNSATLFLNGACNIRVILLNNNLNLRDSVIFKNVQGDFHRPIKAICIPDTTITDIVIDFRENIKNKKY